MVDILHRVGIRTSVDEVYHAVTSVEGLAGWWTIRTEGTGIHVGGVLQFQFEGGGFDMKVLELDAGKRVLWEVVDGPEGAGGVHASLQHPLGGIPDEP